MAPEDARAAQCLQHVRALNRQFKTWVDREWAQHSDALWSGGVADYLRHASGILKEFSDVVEQLTASDQQAGGAPPGVPSVSPILEGSGKAEAAGRDPSAAALDTQGPTQPAATHGLRPLSEPPTGAAPGPSSFGWSANAAGPKPPLVVPPPVATSWPPPAAAGGGRAGGAQGEDAAQAEEEGEEQPESPSVRRAEEEGVSILRECKAKLWIQGRVEGETKWNARGAGAVVVKLLGSGAGGDASGAPGRRVLIFRNEAGKVLLNASLPKGGMKAVQTKNSVTTTLFCAAEAQEASAPDGQALSGPLKATTVLFRVASVEEAVALKETLE